MTPGRSALGAPLRRREDARLVTGRGRYLDDISMPGLLHAVLVRSPHAHADITRLDLTAARAVEGVVAVLSRAELPEGAGSIPALVPEPKRRGYEHPVLAAHRVRHAGEAVAVVVATDVYRAADGAAAVQIEYAPLPAATDAATAAKGPLVQPDWSDNLFAATASAVGDVAKGFAEATVTERLQLHYPRVAGTPIEPRGVLAHLDETGRGLTVWTSTQVPFSVRAAIAGILGVPEERIRVMAPEIGGGFGIKGHVYPEDVLIPAVARHLRRPVKWVETRSEHLLTAAADRDQHHDARIGLRADGSIAAIETRFIRDHGAFPTLGEAITLNTINHLPGPYRVPNYEATADNVLTHKTFLAAYRGAGRPEAAFVLDRLLDRAARRAGLDPVELRRRNLVRASEMPYRSGLAYRDGVPINYDPADYVAAFDRLIERFDYAGWRRRQAERKGGTRAIGLGVSAYVEGTGLGPFEGADVRVDPMGKVFVYLGVSQQGQGHETVFAQICAEHLGVSVDDVVVAGGDTQLVGYGMGTIASRVAAVAGPAVAQAATEVGHKARRVAAELFECAAEDVILREGHAEVRGAPDRKLPFARLARAALRSRASAMAGGAPGLSACAFFYPGSVTWAFGGQAVAVEVDTETGVVTLLRCVAVHDCGRPINPMIVEGQLHGGITQGIGSALREELIYDETGQLLTATFMDYCPPRADEVPSLDVVSVDFPSTVNPLGIKGVGESGIIAGAAAIGNAVEDALADRGVVVTRVPLTPSRVFELLRAASARRSSGGTAGPQVPQRAGAPGQALSARIRRKHRIAHRDAQTGGQVLLRRAPGDGPGARGGISRGGP